MGRFSLFVATAFGCASLICASARADFITFNSGSLTSSVQADSVMHGGIVNGNPPNVLYTTDLSPHSIEATANAGGFATIDFLTTSTRGTDSLSITANNTSSASGGNNNVSGGATVRELLTLNSPATLIGAMTATTHTRVLEMDVTNSTHTQTFWVFLGAASSHTFAAGTYLITVPIQVDANSSGSGVPEIVTASLTVAPEPGVATGLVTALSLALRRRSRRSN